MQDEKLAEAVQNMSDYLEKTDKINQRLTSLIKILFIGMVVAVIGLGICNTVSVCYKDYAYFFSSYQYPEVQQEVSNETDQIKQSIGKESDE